MRVVQPGRLLFEFTSKQDWIDNAQWRYRGHAVNNQTTVAIDSKGRLCGWGQHFTIAEKDDAYPIRVYLLRPDLDQPGKDAGEDRSKNI